tara:strand:- start:354 stop:749 length:396 start_codon:yes stop_codon:yes gene_type:complete
MKITETGIDSGGIQLIKVEFDDGQWWEFRQEINWGTSRQIRKVLSGIDMTDPDIDAAHEAQVLRVAGSTESWSFKLPVSISSIDRVADWRVRSVLTYMVERHSIGGITDETKKASGWRLFFGRIFQKNLRK